ncbi:hypothetical protein AAFC00_005512 [Neodothiora populina]|uniref:SUZ-C domain-containing protein n=1 Tax=Neodothiora populina TaxID=2781224 RepID=A0ABR3PM75_9PEZI
MGKVPDAWDDDWVNVADTSTIDTEPQQPIKISRAERRAQHQEANKQLWQAAEEPERFSFLETKTAATPVRTADFKPIVTVLSRKPQSAKTTKQSGSSTPAAVLDDGDDSEEEERKRREVDFLERQRKATIEREEKQRKYAEVRQRLFGSPAPSSPNRDSSAALQNRNFDSRNSSRRGRARGGKDSRPSSAAHSPAQVTPPQKQLFDPAYTSKPASQSPRPRPPREEQPIRAPRGPDGSGRGGFGFAPRGGRSVA